jgi:hypothetical protein
MDYSEQLTAISENAMGTIKQYISDNLEISDDLQVALVIAMPTTPTWATMDMQKDGSKQVAEYTSDLMSKLGDKLHDAARNYKKGESAGSSLIMKVWGEGVPDDYEEEPHRKGDTNWDGSDLKLKVPKWEKKAPEALELVVGLVDVEIAGISLTDIINYLTGFDVMAWLEDVVPDWGELEGIGAQHGELQEAYTKIRSEIEDGMDYLGSHWDGRAAAAFEHHVRKNWLNGLETIADLHRTNKYCFDALASLIDASIWLWVGMWSQWIKEAKRLLKDVTASLTDPAALWELGESLVGILGDLLDLVLKIGEALIDFLKAVGSAVELACEILGGALSGMAKS